MPTERQSPDAVLASTNLSGGLTDIDDDPDSPDASWMVASGNNVATDVRTSFPSPTGSPTVGADLQEFRAQVRKQGGTGTPQARIELWENGTLVRAGSNAGVTSTSGQVISFTWNANELGTSDGSLVELKVVGTQSGGSPAVRASVDVGAVEWNVDYSAAGPITATLTENTSAATDGVTGDILVKGSLTENVSAATDAVTGSTSTGVSATLTETVAAATDAASSDVLVKGSVAEQASAATDAVVGSTLLTTAATLSEMAAAATDSVGGDVLIKASLPAEQVSQATDNITVGDAASASAQLAEFVSPAIDYMTGHNYLLPWHKIRGDIHAICKEID